jgi:hypothetical protein
MNTFELTPVNNRKSFYGKCRVEQEGNISYLRSYQTIVAEYHHDTNTMIVKGYFSPTTATHLNTFLSYYGFDTCNKKQLENYNKVLS